jgi:hypothetical protein
MRLIDGAASLCTGFALCAIAFAASAQVVAPNPALTLDAAGGARILVRQGDGKIIAAGAFTKANGSPRSSLARFNADGTLDYASRPSRTGGLPWWSDKRSSRQAFTRSAWRARASGCIADGTVASLIKPTADGDAADPATYAAGALARSAAGGHRLLKLNGDTGAADAAWNPAFGRSPAWTPPSWRALPSSAAWRQTRPATAGPCHLAALTSAFRDPGWAPPHALVNNEGKDVVIAFDGTGNVFVAGPGGSRPHGSLRHRPAAPGAASHRRQIPRRDQRRIPHGRPPNGSSFVAVDGASVYTALDGVLFGGAGRRRGPSPQDAATVPCAPAGRASTPA